jgi:hypothetical protein
MNTATAVIALVLAYLLVKFMPGSKWAFKFAILALLLAAVNFSGGWIGRTVSSVATFGTGTTATVTQGATGVAVPAILGITAAFVVGWALWPKHAVTRSSGKGLQSGSLALVAAVLLPIWATSIGGPVGGLVRCGVTQAQNVTGGVVGAGFGTGTLVGLGQPCVNLPSTITPPQPPRAPAPGTGGTQAEGGR